MFEQMVCIAVDILKLLRQNFPGNSRNVVEILCARCDASEADNYAELTTRRDQVLYIGKYNPPQSIIIVACSFSGRPLPAVAGQCYIILHINHYKSEAVAIEPA